MNQGRTYVANRGTSAGYIVHNNEAIWGRGATSDLAWADFMDGMRNANVRVVDKLEPDEHGDTLNQTRASTYLTCPASAALLQQVEDQGGNISWDVVDGIACARDEAEAVPDDFAVKITACPQKPFDNSDWIAWLCTESGVHIQVRIGCQANEAEARAILERLAK